ncbi:MAG: A/G-specific adenine glycosylase [Desulfobacterales bacterium]|nr:A/G-specific adenine glycosylase [Desulfobacterales bacterium]
MTAGGLDRLRRRLLAWYGRNARPLPWRQTRDPYPIWVSEVMAQQTQIKTVVPYYHRFMNRFETVGHLAAADSQEVLKTWEGLGYYGRARNLHRAAQVVVDRWNGEIPDDWDQFHSLPGVGDYIASAVLSIAFGRPYAVVDGNVKRVLSRLQKIDIPVNGSGGHRAFQAAAQSLLDPSDSAMFNQAMMELGALICSPRTPKCDACPIRDFCLARKQGMVDLYPRREKRRPVPEYRIALGVVRKNGRVLITRRKPEGLLGGLWEFPGGKLLADEPPEQACARKIREAVNLEVEVTSKIARIRHAYTHFKIVADVFWCRYVSGRVRRNGPVAHQWIRVGEIDQYPFPGANHKFIPLLK